MTSLSVTEARAKLNQLLDAAAASHEAILITGKRANAVLMAEEDWRGMQETLYLISMPGMRTTIRDGLDESLTLASRDPGW